MTPRDPQDLQNMLAAIRACAICENLPLGPKPLLQAGHGAKILIAGQAPGSKTHEKGRPFDDQSGKRLRNWLGVDEKSFYNPAHFAVVPMGFCFPGTGAGGDLPPRPECAVQWRQKLLDQLPGIELVLVLGQHAMDWHLGRRKSKTLTETVRRWPEFWPGILPLPHPSPRNIRWFKTNPWFEDKVIPVLQKRIKTLL